MTVSDFNKIVNDAGGDDYIIGLMFNGGAKLIFIAYNDDKRTLRKFDRTKDMLGDNIFVDRRSVDGIPLRFYKSIEELEGIITIESYITDKEVRKQLTTRSF